MITAAQLAEWERTLVDLTDPDDPVGSLLTEVHRLRTLVAELATWADSPDVQGAFFSAWNHGQRVDPTLAAQAQAMWDRARAVRTAVGR